MEGLQSASGVSPASLPGDSTLWRKLVNEQVFFVKKAVSSCGVEGFRVPDEIGDAVEVMQDEVIESAVLCDAVEFEDLFVNPIEQGSNLEFRVSKDTVGENEAMDINGAVFGSFAKSEVVIVDGVVGVAHEANVGECRGKEELTQIDLKAGLNEMGVQEVRKLIQSVERTWEEVKWEEVKIADESVSTILNRLELQMKFVNLHIDELQRIIALQCRLMEANPLAQELASAILGTKEGSYGYCLSAETLRYLLAIFAVKDTLTKKEARDIGVISGATLTQVIFSRCEIFFATQRSRVRALVHQYTDEAEAGLFEIVEEQTGQMCGIDFTMTKLIDVDSVELLLDAMRQGSHYTQQQKLLQIMLRTEPGLILRSESVMRWGGEDRVPHFALVPLNLLTFDIWGEHGDSFLVLGRFLEKGGLKVLCGWLITAAADEQTSVLRLLLHVLSHLPMSCANPLHVSALLQPVNKLRFYFVQDVANHARILMSKWSNLFMNKVEGEMPIDSAGLGSFIKGNLDVPRRLQKRGRDPAASMKRYEGGLTKTRTAELVKDQIGLPGVSVRTLSSWGAMGFSSRLAQATTRSAGVNITKPRFDLKSKTGVTELPIYNPSKINALAAMHRSFRKIVPGKGDLQLQAAIEPCLSEAVVVGDIATNRGLGVGAHSPLLGPPSRLTLSQAPKARRACIADEGPKGAAKVAIVMSNIRRASAFPVSEAANIATPVSRKYSLVDQQKERRKVLPVEDPGNGNRWRESTARRSIIEVGKTARPLSADEIRKAKLRARLMQLPTGTSGHKSVNTQELLSSRGKPMLVGDGWSLDRFASMQVLDGGDKPTQVGGGVPLRPLTTSNVDGSSAPRQALDDTTFSQLLSEQAGEAKVPGFEKDSNIRTSHICLLSLENGAESIGHWHDVSLPECGSDLDLGMNIEPAITTDVDVKPPSPSIAIAFCGGSTDTVSDAVDDVSAINGPVNGSSEDLVLDIVAEDLITELASVQSGYLTVEAPEHVNGRGIEARYVPWVVPLVVNLKSIWCVVAGDASKELGVQAARVNREEEEVYFDLVSIPDNPKDLWDEEIVYDDTLTPEIPVEFLEISPSKTCSLSALVNQGLDHNPSTSGTVAAAGILGSLHVAGTNSIGAAQQIGDAVSSHDPNLLALLLSNPHLLSHLALQQKGYNNLSGVSAILELENIGCQSALTQVQEDPSLPTNKSNTSALLQLSHVEQSPPAAIQPRDQVVEIADFHGGQTLSTSTGGPFSVTSAESVRIVEDTPGAVAPVLSWGVSCWALPSPLPGSTIGLTMPSQGSSILPACGSIPQEFLSLGPPAYNGSFQKLQNAPCTWAPFNSVMHTTAKLFGSPLGRGRLPVKSHSVNGASGMPDVVDDATVSSVLPPVFGQVALNTLGCPPHGNDIGNNVHNVFHAVNSSVQGNVSSLTQSNIHEGYPDLYRQVAESPSLRNRTQMLSPSLSTTLPPSFPLCNHQCWQSQDSSSRPFTSHPPLRQHCRPPHPSAWHLNGSNYGPNG